MPSSSLARFYTYQWLRKDGTPYYVGKGCNNRGFYGFGRRVQPPPDKTRILVTFHASEEDAFAEEKLLIAKWGRKDLGGVLYNYTDGGEGTSGAICSESHREKLSSAMKGNSNGSGYRHTAEALKKISESSKKADYSGRGKKIGDALRGKRKSESHRLKNVESGKKGALARWKNHVKVK
jgi:hypothetical protein